MQDEVFISQRVIKTDEVMSPLNAVHISITIMLDSEKCSQSKKRWSGNEFGLLEKKVNFT